MLHKKHHPTEDVFFTNGTQPNWKKQGKEFVLHGHLYDVVEAKQEEGGTRYICYRDEIETILEAAFNMSSNDPIHPVKHIHRSVLLTLCSLPPPVLIFSTAPLSSLHAFPHGVYSIKSIGSCDQEQPPELV